MAEPDPRLLSQMAILAYRKRGESEDQWSDRIIRYLSCHSHTFVDCFDHGGTQGFIARRLDANEFVVAFRGTEITSSEDIRTDLRAWPRLDRLGWVHAGFAVALDEVWDLVRFQLTVRMKIAPGKVWFTGHSMGGALAVIAASRVLREQYVAGVVTFGAPPSVFPFTAKVLKRMLNGNCIRVERADVVTMLLRLIYRSPGVRLYITRHGRIIERAGWHVALADRIGVYRDGIIDRLQSFVRGEWSRVFAWPRLFMNHSMMTHYVDALRGYGT